MPTFHVTGPDGATYEVSGPDGATEQDALAQVQAQHAPKYQGATNPTLQFGPLDTHIPIPAALSTSLEGTGKFFNDVGVGARQLFTGQTQADRESEARDAPLMGTLPGKVGYATGALSTALAAPVTGVAAAGGVGALMNSVLPADSPEDRLKNMALGGVAGGLGQAVANGAGSVWRWLRTPGASTLTSSQQQTVQRALEMGYDLTPAQVTGKRWQQNLEAALDSFPGASGRAQARVAGNQANTDSIVSGALDSAGGVIDQPTAAAAAMSGWKQGSAAQKADLGQAYDALIQPATVDLTRAAPQLAAIRQAQSALPPQSQTGPAMSAIDELIGKNGEPGWIAQNPSVPGKTAQNLRSDYSASARTADGRDAGIYGQMKSAIDGAIEDSLPAASKDAFKAVNAKYGVYKAVADLEPKQQDAFLSQLYRGSKSPDQFFSFLGMSPDPEFQQVARGFLSRMIEGASTDAGVNAAKLGKLVDAANPDAKRFFGGAAIDVLNDVGRAGGVLSDKVPNSGTAQRLMWQGLLMAPGSVLGGVEGYRHGGAEGAIGGAGMGAALGRYGTGPAVSALYHSGAARNMLTKTAIDAPSALLADILRQYGASLPIATRTTSNQ